jgi:transcriptional regulator with GAF, ATPase, and Fis domain
MISGLAECPDVALARIWLIDTADRCPICQDRNHLHGDEPALHLVASAGTSRFPGNDYSRLSGRFHRFGIGERKIGHVAQTAEPLLLTGLRGNESWIAEPEWAESEGISSFAAQPMMFRDQLLGVLAVFDRDLLDAERLEWLRVFADYAAVSVANARALEEIDSLQTRLEGENRYLREEVSLALGMDHFVGESPALRKVLRQVTLAAPTDAAVLIMGESGTGKELVARAIHDRSHRSGHALIKVNCSAIPDALFESEFFGHARGAFTGAVSARAGRFELADGGTLFLDEVGELPLASQAKLLRVLQEKEFERVGETRIRSADVRVIAATNRDLAREVSAGRFRQDLYYRLSVFPLVLPPLRERPEDIPVLVRHFLAVTAAKMSRPVPELNATLIERMMKHAWPGNIRELQNAVERAIILWQGGPLHVPLDSPNSSESETPTPLADTPRLLTRDDLKQLERRSILCALEETEGQVFGSFGAASLLGMPPTTLASRMMALGIKRPARRP